MFRIRCLQTSYTMCVTLVTRLAEENMARSLKFGPLLREIRIHLCQKSDPSKGAREFVEKHYVDLKKNNPKFPILIRECSGVQPKLWARYEGGKESSVSLSSLSADDVLKQIDLVSRKA